MVFVAGDAGIGKTSLLRMFCSERANGARVVVGWCDGLRTPRPLAPFIDIGAEVGGHLEQVVAGGEDARSAFAALVDELRSARQTIVVIEDVHWADYATLDVLRLLGRRIEQLGSLVVVTYRADELHRTHPLRIALGDLATAAGILRLRLDPLSPKAVKELAAPYGIDAADLYAKTAGNPFFVTRYWRAEAAT